MTSCTVRGSSLNCSFCSLVHDLGASIGGCSAGSGAVSVGSASVASSAGATSSAGAESSVGAAASTGASACCSSFASFFQRNCVSALAASRAEIGVSSLTGTTVIPLSGAVLSSDIIFLLLAFQSLDAGKVGCCQLPAVNQFAKMLLHLADDLHRLPESLAALLVGDVGNQPVVDVFFL